jgi:hypothetical protein
MSDAEEAAFWASQDALPLWTVPLSHGASMPFLKPHERGLLVAMSRAHRLGKTPLLVDHSEEHLIDTYYSYQAALVIEAKQLVLDVATKRRSHEEIMEECRRSLVNAMRYGQTLYIRMSDSACDFSASFNGETTFPTHSLLAQPVVADLATYREGSSNNLWGSEHPLAAVLREEDLAHGHVFQPRFSHKVKGGTTEAAVMAAGTAASTAAGADAALVDGTGGEGGACTGGGEGGACTGGDDEGEREGFELVICTHLSADSFASMLADALPLHLLQPIRPLPSTVRLRFSHYNEEFGLEMGGSLRWETIDDKYALSFVYKGAFVVALVETAQQRDRPGPRSDRRDWRSGRRGRPEQAHDVAQPEPAESPKRFALDGLSGRFMGLECGRSYDILIEEDEAAEAAARAARASGDQQGGLSATALAATRRAALPPQRSSPAGVPGRSLDGTTRAGTLLADELRGLSVNEVAERSERYRRLREAQDLQDVVFGGI